MKNRLIKRYMLLCMPFVLGIVLYRYRIFNILSSVLFFGGGYIAIKNICDYRKINKNIRLFSDSYDKNYNINDMDNRDNVISQSIGKDSNKNLEFVKDNSKYNYKHREDNINGLKNTRRYIRVRRRY